jgi:precorrin 3B synthase CobZ
MALPEESTDVLVIGSGNAGFSAAISAAQSGANSVTLIDKCPEDWAGGNSYFTAGAFRTAHSGLADILPLVNNVDPEMAGKIDLESYEEKDFMNDLQRVTAGRSNQELGAALVGDSLETVKWLKELGIRFQLSFNRQAYRVNDRWKFWGGLCLKTQDGGKGLIADHIAAAKRHGIDIQYSTAATEILTDEKTGMVTGVAVEKNGEEKNVVRCKAVIMAAGGFEANEQMRREHLGEGWQNAHVRGTPYNTGDLLTIAVRDTYARTTAEWAAAGCHSVAWDAASPKNTGDRLVSNEFTKSGYPLGLMLNADGVRFVDEGVDLRNYTYAKFGRAILEQPDGVTFQVWDSRTIGMLREEEYRDSITKRIGAENLDDLAAKCAVAGLRAPDKFVETIQEYNKAVYARQKVFPDDRFDPSVKDGLSTQSDQNGLKLPKSNWALPLDKPPFLAVKVACGITFTFGGLAVDPETAGVINERTGKEIPGLFCVGEMMGGLFYGNYPGGSGLTSGAVFGRRAGRASVKLTSAT